MAASPTLRDAQIKGLRTFLGYHWLYLEKLREATLTHVGAGGLGAIEHGLHRVGVHRGKWLIERPESLVAESGASALIRFWDLGDQALPGTSVRGDGAEATVSLPRAPGRDFFGDREAGSLVDLYWRNMLAGMAEGYDPRVSIECDDVTAEPWSINVRFEGGDRSDKIDALEDIFGGPAQILISRRQVALLGAIEMYTGFELMEAFDATGEKIVREACYNFGFTRAKPAREAHLEEGLQLGMDTFSGNLQERDPKETILLFNGPGNVTRGVYERECTYCPAAEVWALEGKRGLSLGYIYDMEAHRGLVDAYLPGSVVRWNSLKTRGDRTCKFEFFVPNLVTESDPEWAQKLARGAEGADRRV